MLRRDPSKLSIKQKRRKASINPDFRAEILASQLFVISPWVLRPEHLISEKRR